MTARPLDAKALEPALPEPLDTTTWGAAELIARAEYLHQEVITHAILGPVPLSKQERAKYQAFIDAILEFWTSGDTAGLVGTYADTLRALESLLAERSADASTSSGDEGAP